MAINLWFVDDRHPNSHTYQLSSRLFGVMLYVAHWNEKTIHHFCWSKQQPSISTNGSELSNPGCQRTPFFLFYEED